MKPRQIADRDGWTCGECGAPVDPYENWEIDHEVPKALGGEDTDTNKQLVHFRCHKTKSKQDVGRIAKANRQRAKQERHERVNAKQERRQNARERELSKWKARQIEPLAERQE